MKKILVHVLLVAFSSLVFTACIWPKKAPSQPQEPDVSVDVDHGTEGKEMSEEELTAAQKELSYIYVADKDDITAFELLQSQAEVEYDESDLGILVQGINGTMADDQHYWAFAVNGELAQQGAADTVLKSGDVVEWNYSEL